MKPKCELTKGSTFLALLFFSLPMILSVTLQQFYNICDSMIAGKYISDNALSAVSATYPVTVIYLAIATGFGVGANIITSRYIGEHNEKNVKESIYTSIISIVALALVVTLIGLLLLNVVLKSTNVDYVYYQDAKTYLLYFTLGILFLFLYNCSTNLFQSLGNSKIPLYLLILSIGLNLILDIVLVKKGLGIKGISLATLISQAIASVVSLGILYWYTNKLYPIEAKVFSWNLLKKILSLAIPSIIQGSIISIGGILIQSLINTFSPAVTAGYGSSYKLCYVIVNIYTVMSNAVSTFTSTNAGAKEYGRIKKGFYSTLLICGVLTVVTTSIFLIFPEQLLKIFQNEDTSPEVVKTGKTFIYCVAPFYFLLNIKIPCDGVLKGSKDMRSFMISTFLDLCIRVSMSYILGTMLPEEYRILGIFLSWPIGWFVGMALSVLFYKLGRWKKLIGYEIEESQVL